MFVWGLSCHWRLPSGWCEWAHCPKGGCCQGHQEGRDRCGQIMLYSMIFYKRSIQCALNSRLSFFAGRLVVCEHILDTWEQGEEVTKGGQGRRGGWKSAESSSIWLRPRNIPKEIWGRRPWLSEQYRSERDVSLSWECGRLFWCMPMQYCFNPFLRYLGFVSPTAQEVENTSKTDVSQCFDKNVVTGRNYCCIKYVVRWIATHPLSFLYHSDFKLLAKYDCVN